MKRSWARIVSLALFLVPIPARAQAVLPAPTPTTPAAPLIPPTATPKPTGTPSPATLPSVVPAPPTRITPESLVPPIALADPNRVVPNAPIATPSPTPTPTNAPPPTPTPTPNAGDVNGQETPSSDFSLDAPDGVIYDQERNIAVAQGKVTFRYRELSVEGDRGIVDYNTNRAILKGNLRVTARESGRAQTFTGQSLVFELDTGRWLLSQLKTEFPPEYFPPGTVLAPIYQTDGSVRGQGQNARGENFRFSSCDREHYYLRSNRLEFYRLPDGRPQKIVLRRNALFVFHREILPLPVYVISLLGQNSRNQPLQTTAGQNATDGYFVRTLYDLRASAHSSDSLLTDILQKRGLGLGFQREFLGGGLLYLYSVSGGKGGRELDAKVNRAFQISRSLASNVRYQSTRNNSLSGLGIASQTGDLSFVRATERIRTNATYSFDGSSYSSDSLAGSSASSSRRQTYSLTQQQNFGSGLNLNLSALYNQSSFGSGASGETSASSSKSGTGDLNVQLGQNTRAFDAFLRTELHHDFVNRKAAYQLERLPELLLQSSTSRVEVPLLRSVLPGDFTLGVGTFNEPKSSFGGGSSPLGGENSRADFFYNARERRVKLLGTEKNGSIARATGTFEQALYSDNTARYNYAYNGNLTNNLGPLQVALNYSKRRTYGYTPFQFDYTSDGENVDYTASLGRGPNFRLNVSGGRDIQNGYTRDLIENLQWIPAKGAYISLGTSYGLQAERKGKFGDILANLRLTRPREQILGGQFSLGLRYTPSGSQTGLARANASFDTNLTRKFRLQVLAGYDGFNKRFDFQQYRLITDLHCFNLYTTYDGSRHELRLDLALKAFPFADTRFGRNGFSEGFDAGVGEIR